MNPLHALQISPGGASAALTPDQTRFNTLIRQIGQARDALALWQADVDQFRRSYLRVVLPLRVEFDATRRAWVLALDGLLNQPGWNRAERQTLRELVVQAAGALLDECNGDDAELQAVSARHGVPDDDTRRSRAGPAMQPFAEPLTGPDPGDAQDVRSDHRPPRHAKGKAARQREAEALQASQSVREVYRKLASALHPDRAVDAAQCDARTVLMQRVNQAYAASDLLALLALQWEIEQGHAGHIAQAPAQRVGHYNRVLAEQLAALRAELARVEQGFRHEFGVPHGLPARPGKLVPLISQEAGGLRAMLAQQQNELRLLRDRTATRRWLKHQWQALREIARQRDDDRF